MEELVERSFVPERASSVYDRRVPQWRSSADHTKQKQNGVLALTKEALSMMVLLSSLGVWAAVWAAAASMASAWLQ
jgi:hypothetical protein